VRITLFQMLKLVMFAAVASACLAPAARLVDAGVGSWPGFLVMEAVIIPMVLAVVAFPLVRPGPLKEWWIRVLLMISLAVALGMAVYFLVWASWHMRRRGTLDELSFVALDLLVIVILVLGLGVLLSQAVPGKCPACRRRALLPAARGRIQAGDRGERVYECLRCGRRAFRLHGAWTSEAQAPAARVELGPE
jgi:hypothetical protein